MCFSSKTAAATTPAPAPEAPAKPATEQGLLDNRKAEDQANFGTSSPSLRVDRTGNSGSAAAGGTGLRM